MTRRQSYLSSVVRHIDQLTIDTPSSVPDDEIDQIYFPPSGMISLVMVTKDGKAIETATVATGGVVGAMAGLELHRTGVRALAQLPLFAALVSASQLRKAAIASKAIADLCIRYNETLLDQARVPRRVMLYTRSNLASAGGSCRVATAPKATSYSYRDHAIALPELYVVTISAYSFSVLVWAEELDCA